MNNNQGLDLNQAVRAALVVIVAGILLLALTFLVEFLVPLIVLAVLVVLAYLLYKWFTTGTFGF